MPTRATHRGGVINKKMELDLTQMTSLPFLKVSDVKDGDKLIVTSTPKREINRWQKDVVTFYAKHNGVDKVVSVNAKSPQVQKIVAILGLNPVSWIGGTLTLKKANVTLKDGKAVQALDFFK